MTTERIYLDVPFSEKDEAKLLGALWDSGVKKWYAKDDHAFLNLIKWKEVVEPDDPSIPFWISEKGKDKNVKEVNVGKWMIFVDKPDMDKTWTIVVEAYRDGTLSDVLSLQRSTNRKNPSASSNRTGVIFFYCNHSECEQEIIACGQKIKDLLKIVVPINYKMNVGSNNNWSYKL